MRAAASFAVELVAAVLAPPRCAASEAQVARLAAFCSPAHRRCSARRQATWAPRAPWPHSSTVARSHERSCVSSTRIVPTSRAHSRTCCGVPSSSALEPNAAALSGVLVVPVPLHPSRLADRGFSQSALIASRIAHRLGAPRKPRALARVRDTPQQASLDRADRLANLSGAFLVRRPEHVRARDVLLIDDVRTTGAALDACTPRPPRRRRPLRPLRCRRSGSKQSGGAGVG